MKLENFHETLSSALNNALAYHAAEGVKMSEAEEYNLREKFAFDGVKYEQTKQASGPIESIKGKATKKWLHISIYRMSSGRYELTTYCL